MRRPLRYYRELGAVSLMRMGWNDYDRIAALVDLSPADVERIDQAPDPRMRFWAIRGTPLGEYAELTQTIRCRECGSRIDKVPCLACTLARQVRLTA